MITFYSIRPHISEAKQYHNFFKDLGKANFQMIIFKTSYLKLLQNELNKMMAHSIPNE